MEKLTIQQIKHLKAMLRASKNTIYCSLNHVSSSGMTRHISFFVVYKGEIVKLNWHLAKLLDYRIAKNGGLVVGGCGMDMGFSVVYSVGRMLHPKGFKLSKERYGRNGDKSGFDKDGGYRYKSQWL